MSVRPLLARKIGVVAILILAVVFGLIGCKKKEEQPVQAPKDDVKQVKLLTIEPSLTSGKREFPGKTEATQIADLAFRISGPLIELPVKEGQRVQEGELIAKIDPRDFKTVVKQVSSSLENARAQLKAMQAGARKEEIGRLQADISAKEASVAEVKTRLDRYSKLYKDKVVAKQQVDTIQAEYDMKVQALESAKQAMSEGKAGARAEDVDAQQATIRGLEAQLQDAQNAVTDTELRAPFNGIVARKYVENHESVQAKQKIVSFQDPQRIEIIIDIPENELARAGERNASVSKVIGSIIQVTAVFPSYPNKEFPVELKAFETEADPKTQTFKATFVMDQPADSPIVPGMNAVIRAKRTVEAGAVITEFHIPVQAVFSDAAGNPNVWIVDPATQQVQRRQIVVNEMAGDRIRVTDGLAAGDVIVLSAVKSLLEGMKVKQMPELDKM